MSQFILKAGLLFIGIAGVLIGASFILFGVNGTGQFFRSVLSVFIETDALTGLDNPNADSELRFYSVFWIAYGLCLIRAARDLTSQMGQIPWLIGLFFAGGVARFVSFIAAGPPHPLFILLMVIELVLPVILLLCWRRVRAVQE